MHLSPTRVSMLMRCPMQYYFRYVLGQIRPPNASRALGSVYHNAIASVTETHRAVAVGGDLIGELAADTFADEFELYRDLTEIAWDEDLGRIKDAGVLMAQVGSQEFIAPLRPGVITGVEARFEVEVPDADVTLVGIRDLVITDGGITVIDHKTAARAWPKGRPAQEIQPPLYTLPEWLVGESAPGFRFNITVRPGRGGQVRTQTLPPQNAAPLALSLEEMNWWLNVIRNTATLVKAGLFIPNPTGWWCSSEWCAYYDLCRRPSISIPVEWMRAVEGAPVE